MKILINANVRYFRRRVNKKISQSPALCWSEAETPPGGLRGWHLSLVNIPADQPWSHLAPPEVYAPQVCG